jgi:hypothetical protein
MYELKRLSREAVAPALERAERYRLLNEPVEAESICRDVLAIEPENQKALATLVLALSDQLDENLTVAFDQGRAALARLADEYDRRYYGGILCERRAKAHWRRRGPGCAALAAAWFREALAHYESAITLRRPGNDDPILRWNTCARILMAHPELAAATEPGEPILEMLE